MSKTPPLLPSPPLGSADTLIWAESVTDGPGGRGPPPWPREGAETEIPPLLTTANDSEPCYTLTLAVSDEGTKEQNMESNRLKH